LPGKDYDAIFSVSALRTCLLGEVFAANDR